MHYSQVKVRGQSEQQEQFTKFGEEISTGLQSAVNLVKKGGVTDTTSVRRGHNSSGTVPVN
eukprot:11166240-Ditylum_brightwellii.AAC.2